MEGIRSDEPREILELVKEKLRQKGKLRG